MNKSWTLIVEEDAETGDAMLTFPPDLLEQAGWKEGDTLQWSSLDDSSWQLIKKLTGGEDGKSLS